ncbi:hypothetical protein RJT34_08474 [Clitoria ternatea]|uniref:Uncharacterized protein n=1 Tax=Clitoria ternatea TaxID=43366 RepID=A0AAN9K726_CLITE
MKKTNRRDQEQAESQGKNGRKKASRGFVMAVVFGLCGATTMESGKREERRETRELGFHLVASRMQMTFTFPFSLYTVNWPKNPLMGLLLSPHMYCSFSFYG